MQNEPESLGFVKKPIFEWKPAGVGTLGESSDAELDKLDDFTSFEFGGLLNELRSDLKTHKNAEARLLTDIKRELDGLECVLAGKDIFQSVEQSVARLNNEVQSYQGDAKQLATNLKTVSVMAESISSRVSALDQARSRLVKCLQRVNDLHDLRTCAEGVEIAMKQEEYDEAAHHVQRFFTLDSVLFKCAEQIDTKDSGQSMQECFKILREAAANLKVIIEKKFDEAREANDFASMERFFKIFPLINEHSSGLQRFGNYICSKIEKLGEDNFKILQAGGTDDKRKNVIYADTLTLMFEGIARMIELHQPLIDTFYGPDKLLHLMEIIQGECDKQTIRVINAFIEKRQFEHKAKIVSSYLWSNSSGNSSNSTNNMEKIDALDLDILLSEVTLMHTRSELYWRFLKRRLGEAPSKPLNEIPEKLKSPPQSPQPNPENSPPLSPISLASLNISNDFYDEDDDFYENDEQKKEAKEKALKQRMERNQKLDTLLNRTALSLKMQELIGKYLLIEQYYMMESAKKAIEMDDVEEGSLTSTLLDDVFFIVRKSIRRSICSTSVDCVCAMLNNGVTLLETEFIRHVNSPIRMGYPTQGWTVEAYQTAQSAYNVVLQQGKPTAETAPTGVEKQKNAFLVALNNLRASIDCVTTLKEGLNEDFTRHLNQISTLDKSKLENSVSQMDDLCKKLEYHANLGVGKLCEAAFQSKIKSNAEVYMDINHTLNDELLVEYEISDPFMDNFISLLDKQIAQFENLLLPENYQALLMAVSIETVLQFEKVIYKCSFNRLGGLQLDKEYRQLTSYLTSAAGWAVREKCLRLSQIVSILNSENFEEAIEFVQQQQINGSFSTAALSINEMKRVLSLRTEFPRDKIKALKF